MKRLLSIVAFAGLASSALAQGTVNFQNFVTTEFYIWNGVSWNPVTSGTLGSQDGNGSLETGVLDVGLVWGTSASSASWYSGGTLAGIERIGSTPGQLAGNQAFPIPGTSPGETVYVQVYAWDSSYGDSLAGYEANLVQNYAVGAGVGMNSITGEELAPLQLTLGGPTPPNGTPIFGTAGNVFGKTYLPALPEPGTIALGGLGTAALLAFRRRK